jgi:outer membrane protein assembly factor BamB
MLGANAQRTSAVATEVRGNVRAVWYRPLEPYINYKTQVIAADGRLFISTARGLYALDAATGGVVWVYPTAVPLGHSPTYAAGRIYVGSYDRTIHAVDATTGQRVPGWTPHVALAGYETNPIVVDNRIYAGNRDGYFYCLSATDGRLIWRFKTNGAIRNSAAMDARKTLYFASEDLHAYALRDGGASAQLVWRSEKLLGDTFASYWPVVFRDWVIFSGSAGYFGAPPWASAGQLPWDDKDGIDADLTLTTGRAPGDWPAGSVTMDASPILQYYEAKPHRRRVFMLDRVTGQELTFDTDGDGLPEYAPFTFSGATQSGAKYPPVVGNDGVLYTNVATVATATMWTPSGALVGWTPRTRYLSRVMEWNKHQQAADEPMAFSIGGHLAYWTLCCDRESGSFDLTVPFGRPGRWWLFWEYLGRFTLFPDYEPMYPDDDMDGWGAYGGPLGVYGKHGAQNPWVPYAGRLYRIMGNTVVAVGPDGTATAPLPLARTIRATSLPPEPPRAELRSRLEEEVRKMVEAGHLKPGLFRSNIGDGAMNGNGNSEMDQGAFYFSSPGDTVVALARALPHLSAPLQARTLAYLRSEMSAFPLDTYAYVGHTEGAPRQAAVIPLELSAAFAVGKQTSVYNDRPWRFPLMAFYAAWKYAQLFPGEATRLYTNLASKLTVPCPIADAALVNSTYVLNAYLAGYRGLLELERATGRVESANVRTEYARLLKLRVDTFAIDAPWAGYVRNGFDYFHNFIMARQFLYLVPEVADELRQTRLHEVERAVDVIDAVTPYWFVEGYDATHAEGTHQPLYDVATFNAHAFVLRRGYRELLKYLDAPVFQVGDLLYIQNLAAVLDADDPGPDGGPPPGLSRVRAITP